MLEGKSYKIDNYLLKKQKQCAKKLSKINKRYFGDTIRNKILKTVLDSLGESTIIKEGFRCNYGFNIRIGNNCYINYNVVMLDSFPIDIGNNVFIAPNVVISPVTHPLEADKRKNLIGKKITIEDNVWIGAGAIILEGVTIHKGAIIAAGAIVKNDVDEYTIVGGIPAQVIKSIK